MRLLLIMEEVNCGGAELSFFALCRALASRSRVDLALSAASLENPAIRALCESLRDTSVTVHRCRTSLDPGTLSNLHRRLRRSAARELADLIGTIRPDIVLVNLPTVERGQAVVDAADLVTPRPPVWGFLHLSHRPSVIGAKLGRLRDLLVPRLLRRFDRLLAVSFAGAREITSRYAVRQCDILRPPVASLPAPPLLVDRSTRRASKGLPDGFLLGMVGRVETHQKGQDVALRLMVRLLAEGHPIHLVVVGDGPDMALLRHQADRLNVSSRVLFLGWRQDADDLIQLMSALVMPSKYEGTPLTALQAASVGVPVVGYDVDGLGELLPPGFKVAYGNEAGLSAAIGDLARNLIRWPREELAQLAKSWSDPDLAAERLLGLMGSDLSTGPTGSRSGPLPKNTEGAEEVLPRQDRIEQRRQSSDHEVDREPH